MPRLRPDLDSLRPYRPGRSSAEVAAAYGVDQIVRLGSNEMADPPWPEVVAAVAAAAAGVNRYPDNARTELRTALGAHLGGIDPERIWAGGASNELGTLLAIAFGGPGTSVLYAWPSFGLYPIAARTAGSEAIEVPLTGDHRHDLPAMADATRPDTSVVFVCNPNNPTGTHVAAADLARFIDDLHEDVLVVVDEAYHEFATAPDHRSAVELAATRSNVAVTRTFSKAYGLAGLRCGFGVADPATALEVEKSRGPYTVSGLASAATAAALRDGSDW
ncbi:MAG TPA: aminotransferase class I/II-fold pyridoxal phosphate-dependent enzyme, partial [Acidimicrobiia bacterium]|nr:aminotransferase class I/II-fold pyridoxal phosphate-dependent enzyme [Acidimicrobiia bacterium]